MINNKGNSVTNNSGVHEKTSSLLSRTAEELVEEKIQVGILLYRLRRRSFGGLLFFLSILSLVPGISIFSGISMMILGIQFALGYHTPFLPRIISKYSLRVVHLKSILNTIIPRIIRIEKFIKPRLVLFSLPPFSFVLGILICCLAVIILIPLPFTNFLPALSALIISFALLERDGVLVIVGVALSVLSIALGGLVVYLAHKGLEDIL